MDKTLIERIQKLLALGQSANSHEASAAMARAQELLARHNLSMEQVEASSRESIGQDAGAPILRGSRLSFWRVQLAGVLAKHTGVFIYNERRPAPGGNGYQRELILVGTASNIAVFRAMYHFAEMEFRRLSVRECRGKGLRYAKSWLLGAVVGLQGTLEARRQTPEAMAAGLVTLDRARAEAEAYIRSLLSLKAGKKKRLSLEGDAYGKGVVAGKSLRFHGGEVGAARPTLALGA